MSIRRFLTLREAAPQYGYRSSDSFKAAFDRGSLPKHFLKRIGARKILVDCTGLDEHIAMRDSKKGPDLFE